MFSEKLSFFRENTMEGGSMEIGSKCALLHSQKVRYGEENWNDNHFACFSAAFDVILQIYCWYMDIDSFSIAGAGIGWIAGGLASGSSCSMFLPCFCTPAIVAQACFYLWLYLQILIRLASSVVFWLLLFSKLANHQIRHQATPKVWFEKWLIEITLFHQTCRIIETILSLWT